MHTSTIIAPIVALLATVQYCPAPPLVAPIVAAVAASGEVSTGAVVGGTVAGVVGTAATVGGSVAIENDGNNPLKVRSNSRVYNKRNSKRSSPDLSGLGLGTAWPDCMNELKSANLVFSRTGSTVLAKGMPAACMTLSTVLTGRFDEGDPVPEGSSSIKFTNLDANDVNTLQAALEAHPNYNPSA